MLVSTGLSLTSIGVSSMLRKRISSSANSNLMTDLYALQSSLIRSRLHSARRKVIVAPSDVSIATTFDLFPCPLLGERRYLIDGLCSADEAALLRFKTNCALKVLGTHDDAMDASFTPLVDVMADEELLGIEASSLVAKLVGRLKYALDKSKITSIGDRLSFANAMISRLKRPESSTDNLFNGYWAPHIDKANIPSYDFTAVLWLSNGGGQDFQGGEFVFLDEDSIDRVIQPRVGRLALFGSGAKVDTANLHRVLPVQKGQRFALTVWFSQTDSQ